MSGNNGREGLLTRRITAAFEGVEHPGDDALIPPDAAWDWEAMEIAEQLRGRSRYEISGTAWKRIDPLHFLTPEALHYFLPGMMVSCVREPEACDTFLHHLGWNLCPEGFGLSGDVFRHLRARVSADQASVIASFLRWFADYDSYEQAKILAGAQAWDAIASDKADQEHQEDRDDC